MGLDPGFFLGRFGESIVLTSQSQGVMGDNPEWSLVFKGNPCVSPNLALIRVGGNASETLSVNDGSKD